MTDRKNGPHLYGTADPDNPEPVSKGGMRGERTGDREAEARALKRDIRVDGHDVTIEETSGRVYAEQSGKTGEDMSEQEDR